MLEKKKQLEKEKKELEVASVEKEVELKKKVLSVGNLVHDSVPVSDNEVRYTFRIPNGATGEAEN